MRRVACAVLVVWFASGAGPELKLGAYTGLSAVGPGLQPGARLSGSARGLVPQDYYREVTVGDVVVAPTGNFVAFTVTTQPL